MKKRFPYVSSFVDVRGKRRYQFRRKGYPRHYFKAPYGTKEFEREYAACLEQEKPAIGAGRIRVGSVSDAIARYYADDAFQSLRPTTQKVYRGVLERFRNAYGDDAMRAFDAQRIHKIMNLMREKPHAAARLRKLLLQLFIVARREKLVPDTFDPVKDTRPPRVENLDADGNERGYHRWDEDELAQFEAKHPLGTKPRLAFALLLYAAQRSVDVRYMTHSTIAGGRIRLKQSKTSNAVNVPVVQPLKEALEAGPLGELLLLENNRGTAYTAKGFYNLMKRACIAAGLPHCSAHGLRKAAARRLKERGVDDRDGMAITGHKTLSEYLRYAGRDSEISERSDRAMQRAYGAEMSNPPK